MAHRRGSALSRGSSARVVSLPRGMPEATGDDGSLGAGARRGNAAPRARRARRATAGSAAPESTPPAPAAPPAAPAPMPQVAQPAAPVLPRVSEFAANANLQDVYFEFDKYDIRPDAARILDANATWLKANARNLLLIEGHCDERGTAEYNLALGERRAKSTMNYLVGQGVAASRITVISYGKERPVCTEKTEACWAKNRRAHHLVKAQ